jgi:hypothetical protein
MPCKTIAWFDFSQTELVPTNMTDHYLAGILGSKLINSVDSV